MLVLLCLMAMKAFDHESFGHDGFGHVSTVISPYRFALKLAC